jgi:hypothetical protein
MFGLNFNNLEDLAFITYLDNQRWHVDDCRQQYVEAKTPSHRRAYLRWQVAHLRNIDRCYDALRQRPTAA